MDWLHPNLHVRRLILMSIVSAAMLVAAWMLIDLLTPPQHNPFKPLDLRREPGIVTGFKLDGLTHDKPACFALLDQAGVKYTRFTKVSHQPECGIDNGLVLDQSLTPYSGTLTVSCRLAATLHVWERHVVIPAAREILGQDVARIETLGSYSCRRVNSASTGRWSEHARGEAVDIAGFTLADGTKVMVAEKFRDPGLHGQFLHRVRDRACGLFSATLSPDYNALHHDHLHFDMGFFGVCS
jgi:hypothetical protein